MTTSDDRKSSTPEMRRAAVEAFIDQIRLVCGYEDDECSIEGFEQLLAAQVAWDSYCAPDLLGMAIHAIENLHHWSRKVFEEEGGLADLEERIERARPSASKIKSRLRPTDKLARIDADAWALALATWTGIPKETGLAPVGQRGGPSLKRGAPKAGETRWGTVLYTLFRSALLTSEQSSTQFAKNLTMRARRAGKRPKKAATRKG